MIEPYVMAGDVYARRMPGEGNLVPRNETPGASPV